MADDGVSFEDNDVKGLERIKTILGNINFKNTNYYPRYKSTDPLFDSEDLLKIFNPSMPKPYDVFEIISRIVENSEFVEYKISKVCVK